MVLYHSFTYYVIDSLPLGNGVLTSCCLHCPTDIPHDLPTYTLAAVTDITIL